MADGSPRVPVDRRGFLALTGGSVVASTLSLGTGACSKKEPPPSAEAAPVAAVPVHAGVMRVGSVKTAVEGNVLPELIADFEKASHYKVELTSGEAVYTS